MTRGKTAKARAYQKQWRIANRARIIAYGLQVKGPRAAAHRRERYGLSDEQYQQMLLFQDGCCAICGKKSSQTLCIDHDHATGIVRGLLCRRCNRGLGFFNDDEALLHIAAVYLQMQGRKSGAA